MLRVSTQERGQASVVKPAQEQAVRERERAQRRWAQALARRCPPVAQWADSQMQLPEGSTAPLDGAT